jgi:hypothetical protein
MTEDETQRWAGVGGAYVVASQAMATLLHAVEEAAEAYAQLGEAIKAAAPREES